MLRALGHRPGAPPTSAPCVFARVYSLISFLRLLLWAGSPLWPRGSRTEALGFRERWLAGCQRPERGLSGSQVPVWGRGGGPGSLGSGHRSVNSEQAEACRALLTLPAPETRVRPLQVEKPGSGLCCSWLQNAADSRISVRLGGKGAPHCWGRERGLAIRLLFKLCIWMFWEVAEAFQATSLCSQWRGCWGEARVSPTARRPVAAGNAHILLPTVSMDSPPVTELLGPAAELSRRGWAGPGLVATHFESWDESIGNFHGLWFSLDLKVISALGQEIVNLSD